MEKGVRSLYKRKRRNFLGLFVYFFAGPERERQRQRQRGKYIRFNS